jgi:hypothetical protein
MDYRSIPFIKKLIRMTDYQTAKEVANNALLLDSHIKVKEYISSEMKKLYPDEGF